MQGFIKQDVGPKGEVCDFHTITKAVVDFSKLPDENGEGGSVSLVTLSTFVSKAFYDANRGNADLAIKHRVYEVALLDVAQLVRLPNSDKSTELKCYDIILNQDAFFQDAQIVE